jgi:hypothetical protein
MDIKKQFSQVVDTIYLWVQSSTVIINIHYYFLSIFYSLDIYSFNTYVKWILHTMMSFSFLIGQVNIRRESLFHFYYYKTILSGCRYDLFVSPIINSNNKYTLLLFIYIMTLTWGVKVFVIIWHIINATLVNSWIADNLQIRIMTKNCFFISMINTKITY